MNIWSHWDGEHYVTLALGGYLNPPDDVSPAFFPMYPLLVRSFAELFGGPVSLENPLSCGLPCSHSFSCPSPSTSSSK